MIERRPLRDIIPGLAAALDESMAVVSPWRSLKDDPPDGADVSKCIQLRGPLPSNPEEAHQWFGCSGYVYSYVKRYGTRWDDTNRTRIPAVFTHWMEVPE